MLQDLDEERLDEVFHALANRTRRRAAGTASPAGRRGSAELAEPHGLSVNAISKHLFVLERAGLIRRARSGHVQSCVLDAGPLAGAEAWLGFYRSFWSGKLDRLADFVETDKRQ